MVTAIASSRLPYTVKPSHVAVFNVLGPTVEFLTPLLPEDAAPCLMRGTIPPGGVVPMHAHPDPETFLLVSGEVEGLVEVEPEPKWVRIQPGDVFHVPGGTRHAWRNQTREPAVMCVFSTSKIGRFFQEVGTPIVPGAAPPGPPTPEALQHFQETSARYGYWNASPKENASIGISLAFSPETSWAR
jgi:quercetin dioxygenase-like cupin family protein